MKQSVRWSGGNTQEPGLSPTKLARFLPRDIRETTQNWLFDDMPLQQADCATSVGILGSPAGAMLRLCGVITSLDKETGAARIRPFGLMNLNGEPSGMNFYFLTSFGHNGKKLSALEGLILDMNLQLGKSYTPNVLTTHHSVSVLAFHGVERQLHGASTESRGLLRGEVTGVDKNPYSGLVYGYRLSTEGSVMDVGVSLNNEPTPELWVPGNVVALRALKNGSANHFALDQSPVDPLQPTVLLQPAA